MFIIINIIFVRLCCSNKWRPSEPVSDGSSRWPQSR